MEQTADTASVTTANNPVSIDHRDTRAPRSVSWLGAVGIAGGWTVAMFGWFWYFRGDLLLDHEETGYALRTVRLPRSSVSAFLDSIYEGPTGPLQALLGFPSQTLFGTNPATVFWVNIALTATTALVAYRTARALASPGAGLAACGLLLLAPGTIENARGALTMVPATTFAAVALSILVAGRGLRTVRTSVAFGLACAAVLLSRPMSAVLLVGLAIPAWVWSDVSRERAAQFARNGAISMAAALAGSAWWWAFTFKGVLGYLSKGAPQVATDDRWHVLMNRLGEVLQYLDPLTIDKGFGPPGTTGAIVILGIAAFLVLRYALRSRFPQPRQPDCGIVGAVPPDDRPGSPIWPIWGAVALGIMVSVASDTIGWLMLPVVPWVVIASVSGARRGLSDVPWRIWVAVLLVPALAASVLSSTVYARPGNRFTWCGGSPSAESCAIATREQARQWKAVLDGVVRDMYSLNQWYGGPDGDAEIGLAARDQQLEPGSFVVEALVDHGWTLDPGQFFGADSSPSEQVREVGERADIVVLVPDPDPIAIGFHLTDPDALAAQLVESGLRVCRKADLPDRRTVMIFVREPLPTSLCDP